MSVDLTKPITELLTEDVNYKELNSKAIQYDLSKLSRINFFDNDYELTRNEYASQNLQHPFSAKLKAIVDVVTSNKSIDIATFVPWLRDYLYIKQNTTICFLQDYGTDSHSDANFISCGTHTFHMVLKVNTNLLANFQFLCFIESSATQTSVEFFCSNLSFNSAKQFAREFSEKLNDVVYKPKTKSDSYVISKSHGSFSLTRLNLQNAKSKDSVMSEMFNKAKVVNYPTIEHEKLDKFSQNSGTDLTGKLLLLCGSPGTGKTTYIRHLISEKINSEVKVIFVNPKNVEGFGSPEFINFALANLANSILIIEEAERIIVSREENSISPIGELLNLTDGVLGDALNIRVIATFNTDSVNVDKALKRGGRLFHMQNFPMHTTNQAHKFLEQNIPNLLHEYNPIERDTLYDKLIKQQSKKEGAVFCRQTAAIGLADLYAIVEEWKSSNPITP